MQKVPRYLDTYIPTAYNLQLTINQKKRTFSGSVTISGALASPVDTLPLHAKDLTITSATINGAKAQYEHGENDALLLSTGSKLEGEATIVLEYTAAITDSLHGLYRSEYTHEGKTHDIFVTQLESHHAREVFPCIDEPAAKAIFDVTVTTEDGMQVLGNMPIVQQSTDAGMQTITFDTTPKMSTYLLALVIGDLHSQSAKTANGIDVAVWATPAQRPESLTFALDHAVKSIDFFEDYFGVPYPLPKSDQVALPDFGSGAMENWGLITYREVALLADPATTTIASKQYIATVVSHELSHQWFGNLVTMKWWNNLWLNESFATIMEYIAVDAIHPEWNAWLDFNAHESIMALRRDAIDGVQSVQMDVNHPDEIGTLFDGAIVYAKGARLMRMLREYIGDDAFRAGLKTYFTEFQYSNTEETDLWKHLSAASGKDIATFMTPWISQPGYPVLQVSPDGLQQRQFFVGPSEPASRTWPIVLGSNATTLPAVLDEQSAEIAIDTGTRFNIGDTSHYITHYPAEHLEQLLQQVTEQKLDTASRLQLLHEQTLLVKAGVLSSADLVHLLDAYRNETSESVWSIMALALGELKKFVEDDTEAENALRAIAGDLARPLFEKLGWQQQDGETEEETKLRSTILGMMTYSQDPEVLAHIDEMFAEHDINDINPELRPLILSSVMHRTQDKTEVQRLLELYKNTSSADLRQDIRSGLSSVSQPEFVALILKAFTDNVTIRKQDLTHWFAYMVRSKHGRMASWEWLKAHWSWIEKAFAGDKSYDYFPRYAATSLHTVELLADFSSFFDSMRDNPSLGRTIAMGESEIHARVDLLERDTEAVVAALKHHS